MAKKTQNNDSTTNDTTTQPAESAAPVQNFVLHYRREHPQNRSSFGVPGVPGIVVFDNGLFADGKPPTSITLDVQLQAPRADKKAEKEEERARKAEERARKAQERVEAAKRKAEEKAEKARQQLEAAKAKLAAAGVNTEAPEAAQG